SSASGAATLSLHDALPIWARVPWMDHASRGSFKLGEYDYGQTRGESRHPEHRGYGKKTSDPIRPSKSSFTFAGCCGTFAGRACRSEEHTSELQSRENLVCR